MATKTGTITARPTKYGAKSSNVSIQSVFFTSGKVNLNITGNGNAVFLYGFDFRELKNKKNVNITNISIYYEAMGYGLSSSTCKSSFRLVSGFSTDGSSTDVSTYTDLGDGSVTLWSAGDMSVVNKSTANLTHSSFQSAFNYIQSNVSAFYNGYDTNSFGIRFYGTKVSLYDLAITVTYTYEEVETFTVSTSVTPEGAGTVSPSTQEVESGATASVTATPNAGYRFSHWLINGADSGITTPTLTGTITDNTLYTAVFEKIYIMFDTVFSFKKWKDVGITQGNGIAISNTTESGFTATATVDDAYTAECYVIPVVKGTEYTLECDVSGGNYEIFVFNLSSANIGTWGTSNPPFTVTSNTNKFNFTAVTDYISIRCDAVGTGTVVNFSNFRIYPANYDYMSSSVSATERTDTLSWSIPTPTRDGYNFLGWFTQPNGGGIQYTQNSAFPTTDLVLYSHWILDKINKIYIGTSQPSKIYIGTQEVKAVYVGTTKIYG